jgi:hypothetical protein
MAKLYRAVSVRAVEADFCAIVVPSSGTYDHTADWHVGNSVDLSHDRALVADMALYSRVPLSRISVHRNLLKWGDLSEIILSFHATSNKLESQILEDLLGER